jgi:predicted nucleic acid-binding protein
MRADLRIEKWMAGLNEDDRVVTCTIVRGEILFGIARLAESRRRSDLEEKSRQLFDALPCEPIPGRAGDLYATVKLTRLRRGLALDENDLWVAATTHLYSAQHW